MCRTHVGSNIEIESIWEYLKESDGQETGLIYYYILLYAF